MLALQAELQQLIDEQTDYRALEARLAAWNAWEMESCYERHGGHWWHLDIDPDGAVSLACQHCPAGPDEICPEGIEMLNGVFPVPDGQVLELRSGSLLVNGTYSWTGESTSGWHGPVLAAFDPHEWYDYEYGPQWDPEIVLHAVSADAWHPSGHLRAEGAGHLPRDLGLDLAL
jgi:hypothetical protein